MVNLVAWAAWLAFGLLAVLAVACFAYFVLLGLRLALFRREHGQQLLAGAHVLQFDICASRGGSLGQRCGFAIVILVGAGQRAQRFTGLGSSFGLVAQIWLLGMQDGKDLVFLRFGQFNAMEQRCAALRAEARTRTEAGWRTIGTTGAVGTARTARTARTVAWTVLWTIGTTATGAAVPPRPAGFARFATFQRGRMLAMQFFGTGGASGGQQRQRHGGGQQNMVQALFGVFHAIYPRDAQGTVIV